jgi:predicted DNA-binding transcriptional regulator YafY
MLVLMAVKISLSNDEASKLYALLKSDVEEGNFPYNERLAKALLKKLNRSLSKELKDSAFREYLSEVFEENPWAELHGSRKSWNVIQKALDSDKRVLLKYYSMSSGLTERKVSPIKLNSKYLEAFCHLRNEERQFRVGRIVSARILNKSVLHEKEKSKH